MVVRRDTQNTGTNQSMFRNDAADDDTARGFRHKVWHGITPVLLLGVFLVELVTPRGFCDGILYAIPILTAAFSLDRRLIAAAVTAGSVLTPIGYFISPAGVDADYAIVNRAAAVIVLLATGLLATMAVRHLQAMLNAQSKALFSALELGRTQHLMQVAGRVADRKSTRLNSSH